MTAILVISLSGSGAAGGTPQGEHALSVVMRGGAAPVQSAGAVRKRESRTADSRSRCLSAQRAIRFYRAATNETRLRFSRELPDRIRWPTCFLARRAAHEWQARALSARATFARWWKANYAWRDWLPSNWRRLGACETGYGREPGNWAHDSGRFVSAFGIYRAGYADDAHRIGARSWDETIRDLHRLPTPREQYAAALSHYSANGDGWGCSGP